jgi:hypothetical protein
MALEIFSGFVGAVARATKEIKGVTHSSSPVKLNLNTSKAHAELRSKMTTNILKRISKSLVESGIVNLEKEADAVVIPPFSIYDLLPKTQSSP